MVKEWGLVPSDLRWGDIGLRMAGEELFSWGANK